MIRLPRLAPPRPGTEPPRCQCGDEPATHEMVRETRRGRYRMGLVGPRCLRALLDAALATVDVARCA